MLALPKLSISTSLFKQVIMASLLHYLPPIQNCNFIAKCRSRKLVRHHDGSSTCCKLR